MPESQLPKMLSAQHIKNILQVSYNEAENILDLHLPVIKIGSSKRVRKVDFQKWLQEKKG
jgi:hypothetical protein